MPGFSYVAVDQAGKEIKGSIDAENSERVAETSEETGCCLCRSRSRVY